MSCVGRWVAFSASLFSARNSFWTVCVHFSPKLMCFENFHLKIFVDFVWHYLAFTLCFHSQIWQGFEEDLFLSINFFVMTMSLMFLKAFGSKPGVTQAKPFIFPKLKGEDRSCVLTGPSLPAPGVDWKLFVCWTKACPSSQPCSNSDSDSLQGHSSLWRGKVLEMWHASFCNSAYPDPFSLPLCRVCELNLSL